MANTIPSTVKPLIIGEAQRTLSQTMALMGGVNKDFSAASGKLGDTVNIAVPQALSSADVTPANIAPASSNVTVGSVSMTIDTFKEASFDLSGTDVQNYDLSSYFREQLAEAVRAVCFSANASLWAQYHKIPYHAGTAGTPFFNASPDTLADMRKVLRDNRVDQMNNKFFMSPTDEAACLKVDTLQQANTFGDRSVILDGEIGRLMGFDMFIDQQVPDHVTGTITTGLATKAATPQAVGVTTVQCTTAAATGAIDLKQGDLVTIGGVTYSLQADAVEAVAATDVNIVIDRGLEIAVTGGEAVTLATGHGSSRINIGGDMRGFSVVNRIPETSIFGVEIQGDNKMVVTDPNSGFSLLMVTYGQYYQVQISGCWSLGCRCQSIPAGWYADTPLPS